MSSKTDPRLPETPLRAWRKSSGKSFASLAREVGVTRRTILRIASGAPATPKVAVKLSMATGLAATLFSPAYGAAVALERASTLERLDRLLDALAKMDEMRAAVLAEVAREVG